MKTFILTAPHLGRNVKPILAMLPPMAEPEVLVGERTVPGEVGCLRMHQAAVLLAIGRGLDRICVLEDDCLFTPKYTWNRWVGAAQWAHEQGYGAVHGGSVKTFGARKVHPEALAVDYACSAHAMVYLKASYDAVLHATQPLDWSIGRKGGKPLVIWPFVAVQRAGLSGIGRPVEHAENHFHGLQSVNYEPAFAKHEKALGERFQMGWATC